MFEWFAPSFAYTLVKDTWALVRGRRRNLSPSKVVDLRKKWKAEFESKIWETHKKSLRDDVIIRDMKRIDSYPDLDPEAKGISPWFRVGLVGTYHRGILIGHGGHTLTKHDGGHWRFTNYKAGEKGNIKVLMISSIPYENIDNVDWDGDEFYHFPHIYCFFDHKKMPYEHTAFYTESTLSPMRCLFTRKLLPTIRCAI
jgi:hypothetical protein